MYISGVLVISNLLSVSNCQIKLHRDITGNVMYENSGDRLINNSILHYIISSSPIVGSSLVLYFRKFSGISKTKSVAHPHLLIHRNQTITRPLRRGLLESPFLQGRGTCRARRWQSLRLPESLVWFEMSIPDVLECLYCVLKWLPASSTD